jgi:hypothetical protein
MEEEAVTISTQGEEEEVIILVVGLVDPGGAAAHLPVVKAVSLCNQT